jgi:hypothetical protein
MEQKYDYKIVAPKHAARLVDGENDASLCYKSPTDVLDKFGAENWTLVTVDMGVFYFSREFRYAEAETAAKGEKKNA